MKSNQKRNLEIIDNIDEDIINRNTEKRAALMQVFTLTKRRRTVKRVILSSVAGVVAASILLMILIPMFSLFSKQVPIYKGMSVSGVGTSLIQSSEDARETTHEMPVFLSAIDDPPDKPTKPTKPEKPDEPQKPLWDPNAIGETYFAEPGEDILITVHIDNPDAFEILSFTLNGEKFTAYMFEEGSDLEHLVLKVNVGELEGYHDYTIDAIKYVDGELIKDVRMDGERTIKVGVAQGKNKPLASISNLEAGYDSISLDVSIPDTLGLIKDGGQKIIATLYLGDKVKSSKILESMNEALIFDRLVANEEYRLVITASYDALDGEGVKEHVLAEQYIATACPFTFHHIAEAPSGFYFDLYGGIATTDTSIIINGGELTHDGVTEKVEDLAHFPVPSGDSILTVSFKVGSKNLTAEMQIGPYISDDELREYYTVVESPACRSAPAEDLEPFPTVTLVPSSSNAIIIYALTDGVFNSSDLTVTFRHDNGRQVVMSYPNSKIRRDLAYDANGKQIRKGEAIGCFYTTTLDPSPSVCFYERHFHVTVMDYFDGTFYDPHIILP